MLLPDMVVTTATHAGHVFDVTDTDCQVQNGSTQGREFHNLVILYMSTCIISLPYARLSIGSYAYCILLPYFKNQNQKTLPFFSLETFLSNTLLTRLRVISVLLADRVSVP